MNFHHQTNTDQGDTSVRNAKASSAGLAHRRTSGLGSIRRGALATRASSLDSDGSGAPSHRGARLAIALVLAITGLLAITATPAFALSQVFSTTIGSAGFGAGQLSNPQDVAVDDSTGDIYVADMGNQRVVKFNASGNFILAFGKHVDQTTGGDVCTATSGDTCQAGTEGFGGSSLTHPTWVAVDNSTSSSAGDVYVGSDINGTGSPTSFITKFDSAGNFVSYNDGSSAPNWNRDLQGVAVDPQGNLWAYNGFLVYEFSSSGNLIQHWAEPYAGTGKGDLDVSSAHVFVDRLNQPLARYTLAGNERGTVVGQSDVGPGIAIDPETEDLFVAAGGRIDHYNASCNPVSSSSIIPKIGCPANDTFGSGELTNAVGLGFNAANSTIYAADAPANRIAVFVAPPPGPPAITKQWASIVGSTSATLNATVNPNSNATTCQLQYTTDAAFQSNGYTGASTVSCSPPSVGSRFADHPVAVHLSTLVEGTTYHYRFLAHSSAGDPVGADRTFSTEVPEFNLPDGRAYEQVSPIDKDSTGISPIDPTLGASYQAAADGNRLAFLSFTPFPGSTSYGESVLSARGSNGWSSSFPIPPQSPGGALCTFFLTVSGYSDDLTKTAFSDGYHQEFFGCGKDDPPLVSGEPEGAANLFVRDNVTNTYQLVSLNPVTGPPADATFLAGNPSYSHIVFEEAAQLTNDAPAGTNNLYDWSNGSVKLVSAAGTIPGNGLAPHVISDDGSKIFFQGSDGNLYARVGGTQTVQLDASQGSGPGGGGQFQAASADGSKVFLSDAASAGLTNDTVPGSGQNLYRYDFSTGDLTDLTPAAEVNFEGVSGAGESGADVYFIAFGDLANGATAGQPNLYVSHNGALTFIASLDAAGIDSCVWNKSFFCARVTPDGNHIAFNSDRSLTTVDTQGLAQVYLYDRPSDHLVCASCPPTGAVPTSWAEIPISPFLGGGARYVFTYELSADGSRLFFNTGASLVGRDSNGLPDVYEYENGKPHLISSGTATTGSYLMGASANGDNVFFDTAQRLLPSDIDGAHDVYDARVGGGFPESSPPPPCPAADQCHPGGTVESPVPGAGSAAFNGPGNPEIPRKHKKHHHKKRHHKRTAKHNRRAGK